MDEAINVLYAAAVAEGDERIMAVSLAMGQMRAFNKASAGNKITRMAAAFARESTRPFARNFVRLLAAFVGVRKKNMPAVYAANTDLITRTGVYHALAHVWDTTQKQKQRQPDSRAAGPEAIPCTFAQAHEFFERSFFA